MKNATVLIPAYNEAESIEQVIKEAKETLNTEIIVINDGSTDNTAELAKNAGARVISLKRNMGYGAAIKKGIGAAKFNMVVTIDGDGSYNASELPKLIQQSSKAGLVIGARTGSDLKRQVGRNFFKFFLNRIAGFLVGRNIKDVNSGMRVFDRRVLMKYKDFLCDRFSFSTSSTLVYMGSGRPVKFVDISYFKRKGKSKIRLKDGVRFMSIMLKTACCFRPIRVFGTAGGVLFLSGCAIGIVRIIMFWDLGTLEPLLIIGGLILGSLGLIAEMIRLK